MHPASPSPRPPIRSAALTTPDGPLAVSQMGTPDALPVVFLHGNSLSATRHPEWWTPWWAPGRRLIAIDFPGHGGSPWHGVSPSYSLPDLARCVIAAFDLLHVGRPILIGHSLGGNVALEIGAQGIPLRGIATFGSPPLPSPLPPGGLPLPAALGALFTPLPDAAALRDLGTALFNGDAPVWWTTEYNTTDPQVRAGLAAAVGSPTWRDQVDFVRRCQVPLLMLGGEHDALGQVEPLRALRQGWPGVGPVSIAGASHMDIGHPRVRELVERFCATCAAG